MSEEFKKIESLIERLSKYVNNRIAQLKLATAEKVSKAAAVMIGIIMVAFVFFLFLILLSVAGAIGIGQMINNQWLGFLIMAGVMLLIGFIVWILRDKLIGAPIRNALLKTMFDKEDDDEKE